MLTETKADIVARNFENDTGIDLRDYRRPELVEVIGDLITFPIYAGKFVVIPLAAYLVITAILAIAVSGYMPTVIAVILIPVLSGANALTTASLLFLFRLRDDVTKAAMAGLDLTKEVAKDIRGVYQKRDDKSLVFPRFGLIFQSVMYVVIVPTIIVVLKRKIPLIGGLFSGLVRRLADLTVGRTVKELAGENPGVPDDRVPSEGKEKWLMRRMENVVGISDRAGKIVSRSIGWASLVLLFPVTAVFGVVLAITSAVYWLLLFN
jgi:hypothetical protein